jgi:hypothetical protein
MLGSMKRAWVVLGALFASHVVGCGGVSDGATSTTASDEVVSLSFEDVVALLHPPSVEPRLAALRDEPTSAPAYADAATSYADTDVGIMTFFYGITYGALDLGGSRSEDVARAIARTFRERARVASGGCTMNVAYELLPGSYWVTDERPDGSHRVPLAHVLNVVFSQSARLIPEDLTQPSWFDLTRRTLAAYLRGLVSSQMFIGGESLEIAGWLGELEASGHLDAFVQELVLPAFPEVSAAAPAVDATSIGGLREHVAAHPFRPTRAPLAHDLVTAAPGTY